ncbi:hypothetical protein CDL12_25082 [Handroanthus impetiginosus]|uniref:Uncharacterized protein n=1 Tax=Handroanthus impetiginosus TaxID=429701 RepID=A0A2G9GAU3_9LAMI|nr:hypothetical protein CDL12_25082 [Handroanthus impetiginosus]
MASSPKVTVVEICATSPPPSVPPASLPLTFFDIPWLLFTPTQPLFFFEFPTTTAHFTKFILPNLEHTLTLTLQHFFPLAGKLVTPPLSAEPHLEYTGDDTIFLTIAEAAGDFESLAGYKRKMAQDFHGLVPLLRSEEGAKKPILAIQITVFPQVGICMGFILRHVAADGRTFNNFLKTWASLNKNGEILGVEDLVAFHDRSVIRDPSGLGLIFLKEWWDIENKGSFEVKGESTYDMIRATFVLGPKEMEKIKKWILTRSEKLFGSIHLLLSPYIVTCAFVWVCWMKTHWFKNEDFDDQNYVHYFGFIAGGLTRLGYMVPSTYVGNCVGFGRASATRCELIGENGIVFASKAIGDTIKWLNGDVLGGAKNWISEWKVLHESELHVTVIGSPKLDLYGLDFGWGKPVKIEEVSLDATSAISLCEGREVAGGIEIGLVLPRTKMDAFSHLFNKGLNQFSFVNDS